MSRIYFHSPSDTAEIYGAERYHAESLCQDLMWREFGENEEEWTDILRPYLPGYVRFRPIKEIKLHLASSFAGGKLHINGHEVCVWNAMLNTGIAKGGEGLRLLTRLHGQCEAHCWVDGHNRDWLAGIVEKGLADGALRAEAGWPTLPAFLRERDDEPVVCSFSVGEGFPNYEMLPESHRLKKMAERGDDIDDVIEAYYRMRDRTQWKYCMQTLRSMPGRLEMKPEDWETYHFGAKLTIGFIIDVLRTHASEEADAQAKA